MQNCKQIRPIIKELLRKKFGLRVGVSVGVRVGVRFGVRVGVRIGVGVKNEKYGTLHEFACHPCAGATLIFSVSFQF